MSRVVLLDSGPLGTLTNPKPGPIGVACQRWLLRLRRLGTVVRIPILADYEVRRGLISGGTPKSVAALDKLVNQCGHLEITPRSVELAARLWADIRRHGRPVAADQDLQADVLLAGQALELEAAGIEVWIATENLRHFQSLFARSALWEDIAPS